MTDLLVVGANGQVGWEVSRQARRAGVACRSLSRGELDITNRDLVLRTIGQVRPLIVVNGAAYTAVDKAESDSETAYAVNSDGAKSLAEACAEVGALLIHLSTDYVFDGNRDSPYREGDPAAPLNVYGASKLAGEHAVRAHCPEHVILRTSWIYGVHGNNFVRTMLRLGRKRDKLRIVDDQLGSPTFAGDLGRAIMELVLSLKDGTWPTDGFGTFHCTAHGVTTWCGFARAIFAHTQDGPSVEAISTADYLTPARRPLYSVLDCTKLVQVHDVTLGPWRDALGDMLDELCRPSHVEQPNKRAAL